MIIILERLEAAFFFYTTLPCWFFNPCVFFIKCTFAVSILIYLSVCNKAAPWRHTAFKIWYKSLVTVISLELSTLTQQDRRSRTDERNEILSVMTTDEPCIQCKAVGGIRMASFHILPSLQFLLNTKRSLQCLLNIVALLDNKLMCQI